ncbi:DUF1700 domain-containing protein [Anaerostipes sp.]|uniref:DUF1700 domain-containing protein n=1 Tax=Anaerostipes sp. TaxID=1872530 RepID=UPI0025C0980B|nr:hypothetical protein [Anaerostipes sp.]MBS7009594.1 hypothetical protein [Anaerostipes sp.]
MTREEFLDRLAYLLQDISPEERDDAIGYYADYFEEAGPEREQQVIEELGSPEKVAVMIRDSLKGTTGEHEYTEQGYHNQRYDENTKMPEKAKERSGFHFKGNRDRNLVLIIMLIIGAVVLGLPMIGVVGGTAVGIFGVFFGIVSAVAGVSVGLLAGGFGMFAAGIVKMFTHLPAGLMMSGGGLIMMAVGLLFCILFVWILVKVIPPCIRGIVNLFQRIFHKGGEKI